MKGLLVRVGIDQTYGRWNAPVDTATNRFVFVPIPDSSYNDGRYIPSGERLYGDEVVATVEQFGVECGKPDDRCFRLPPPLHRQPMHLDPDFRQLTYGDDSHRGRLLKEFDEGDFLAFYSSFRPLQPGKLVYALIGLFVLSGRPVDASKIPEADRFRNAHTRWKNTKPGDIIAFGEDSESGLFDRCIPIGEWRDNAYRVRKDILTEWGGISPVKNGWIQRSANLPLFRDPGRFKRWLDQKRANQNIRLLRSEYLVPIAKGTQAE